VNGLQTSRVLVVDDDPKDAIALMEAFARVGVGAVFSNGDPEGMPLQPNLTGIRLAALDLDLAGAFGQPEAGVIAPTLKCVESLIAKNNGPYLALAWTDHPEITETFRELIKALPCPPVHVLRLAKADVKRDGEYDFTQIEAHLRGAIEQAYPLGLFGLWEQLVHDAASRTVNVASESNGGWIAESQRMLAALLREASRDSDDDSTCLRVLFESLDPIHFDFLDSSVTSLTGAQAALIQPLRECTYTADLALKAHLNTKLLLGPPVPDPAPGSMYLAVEVATKAGELAAATIPSFEDLRDDMFDKPDNDSDDSSGSIPVLIEVTPICDFQHRRKMKVARLIAGLAIPATRLWTQSGKPRKKTQLKKNSAFVRALPPLYLQGPEFNEPVVLAWDAHFLVTLPLTELSKCDAVKRLRTTPLFDLQAWAASQSARPGYLSIRE
jgi:hypothetical protein